MEGLQEVINALSIFWVAAIFLLPVSPLRPPRRPFLPYFCPYSPAIGTMVQVDFLAANHVRIVGLCGQTRAHRAVIFAIAQLSYFLYLLLRPSKVDEYVSVFVGSRVPLSSKRPLLSVEVSICLSVCCVTFAESESCCHSILFVWMSVIPRPIAYHD